MRLLTTALTSTLILALGVTACGDDEDDGTGGRGGRGGSGGSAGTAGGGSGGKGGSGGGGTAGTGGGDAGGIAACVQRAQESFGTCTPLAECSCTNCKDELDACYGDPGCVAVRQCAARTNCCPPQLPSCVGQSCLEACSGVIAEAGAGTTLATALSTCVYTNSNCAPCPPADGGTEGGTEGGAGDAAPE